MKKDIPHVVEPSVANIRTALRLCAQDEPADKRPCEGCYLYPLSKDGQMSTGQTCFMHLALDAIALIDRLNNFDQTQSKKLLEILAKAQAERDAAVQIIRERDQHQGKAHECKSWNGIGCNLGHTAGCSFCNEWQWRGSRKESD